MTSIPQVAGLSSVRARSAVVVALLKTEAPGTRIVYDEGPALVGDHSVDRNLSSRVDQFAKIWSNKNGLGNIHVYTRREDDKVRAYVHTDVNAAPETRESVSDVIETEAKAKAKVSRMRNGRRKTYAERAEGIFTKLYEGSRSTPVATDRFGLDTSAARIKSLRNKNEYLKRVIENMPGFETLGYDLSVRKNNTTVYLYATKR